MCKYSPLSFFWKIHENNRPVGVIQKSPVISLFFLFWQLDEDFIKILKLWSFQFVLEYFSNSDGCKQFNIFTDFNFASWRVQTAASTNTSWIISKRDSAGDTSGFRESPLILKRSASERISKTDFVGSFIFLHAFMVWLLRQKKGKTLYTALTVQWMKR